MNKEKKSDLLPNAKGMPVCDRCSVDLLDHEFEARPAGEMVGTYCDSCYNKFLSKAGTAPKFGPVQTLGE